MKREVIQDIDLDSIAVKPQVRDALEGQQPEGLAKSIKAVGLQQPVRLRREDGKLLIVDGERRYWAAKLLGWKQIPAIIEERELCRAEVIQRQLIANCQRKALKPAEFGQAIEELIEATKWGLEEVSEMTGFSVPTLSKHRPLASLPAAIREQVDARDIPYSTAYEIAKAAEHPEKQRELAEGAATGELTRDDVSAQVRALKKGQPLVDEATISRCRVALDEGVVTVNGCNLSEAGVVAMLAKALKRARKAASDGLRGKVFILALSDPASSKRK